MINLGRLVMLAIWAFLLVNLFRPFPAPGNYFLIAGLAFLVVMHGFKLLMLKTMVLPGEATPSRAQLCRIFIFGVFELIAWQRKRQRQLDKHTSV